MLTDCQLKVRDAIRDIMAQETERVNYLFTQQVELNISNEKMKRMQEQVLLHRDEYVSMMDKLNLR